MTKLDDRPRVGSLVVPFMVDEDRSPIDFKINDLERIRQCAEDGLCGICGGRIRRGPIGFIGPTVDVNGSDRACFADPWVHPECGRVALEQCPFLAGRRDWRQLTGNAVIDDLATTIYRPGQMELVLAYNWRAHADPAGRWHFEAVGLVHADRPAPKANPYGPDLVAQAG